MDYKEFSDIIMKVYKKRLEEKEENVIKKEFANRLKVELRQAEVYYNDLGDLLKDLMTKPIQSDRYVIPYLLQLTKTINLDEPIQYIQVKDGASGGIDIDSDFSLSDKQKILEYLKEKYGADCVTAVGTIGTMKMKNASKDLLRYYGASVKESNLFTSGLDDDLTWEENLLKFKETDKERYEIYERNENILQMVPHFLGKSRQVGKHAGGIVLTPLPIWNYCPVELSSDEIVTAFQESGAKTALDSIGLIKLDILCISVLDTIKEALSLVSESYYEIIEDGIEKIVPLSYLEEKKSEIVSGK